MNATERAAEGWVRSQAGGVEPAVMTSAKKRGACWLIEGVVQRHGRWLKASFTAHAPDVEHMNEDEFRAFVIRTLPSVTEDIDFSEHMTV